MPLALVLMATLSSPKPGLAVMDMKVEAGLSQGVGSLLNERLITEFQKSPVFGQILGASDMREMLDLEQQKTALGCGDSNCLAELGGALGVPYLLTSSVGQVGSRLMLNIKLLAVEEARVVTRSSTIYDNEDQLVDGLTDDVQKMLVQAFGDRSKTSKGTSPNSAPTSPVKTTNQRQPRRFSWLGLALLGSSVGVFAVMAPSTDDLIQARQDYDHALDSDALYDADNHLTQQIDRFSAARTTAVTIGALGVSLNLWSFWSSR